MQWVSIIALLISLFCILYVWHSNKKLTEKFIKISRNDEYKLGVYSERLKIHQELLNEVVVILLKNKSGANVKKEIEKLRERIIANVLYLDRDVAEKVLRYTRIIQGTEKLKKGESKDRLLAEIHHSIRTKLDVAWSDVRMDKLLEN